LTVEQTPGSATEAHAPLMRAAFERQRAAARSVERREGLLLAGVSVALGVAQLVFLRWADAHLDRSTKLAIELPAFFTYLAVVGWLLWRFIQRIKAARPKCPRCGAPLSELSERVAVATGRCDSCGGQILA
jgi:TFIIB-like protein